MKKMIVAGAQFSDSKSAIEYEASKVDYHLLEAYKHATNLKKYTGGPLEEDVKKLLEAIETANKALYQVERFYTDQNAYFEERY